MVRRAILDRGDDVAADDEALPPSQLPEARNDPARAHWRGSGGRWLVWAARAVAWAVLILIGYRGVLAIVEGQGTGTTAGPRPVAAAPATQFPVSLADAYALEFGQVYLNFSPATAAARGAQLAAFLPPGSDPELGWDGAGTQHLVSEQVAGVSVTSSRTAVVTLLARVSGAGMIELGVPVYASGTGISVSGDPSFLSGPAKAVPPQGSQAAGDQATETALQSQLPAFFQAYASGDRSTLARFTVPGAKITGLGGIVSYSSIDSVYAPAGGTRRQITATVTWQLPSSSAAGAIASAPATLPMSYQMTVVYSGGGWDVASIGASTAALPQGPP
jgi:hypothetical protein